MAKSPISVLQELSIKQGYVPIYNYSMKKVGICDQFVCRVECKKFSAEGIGNSKKDAKQKAAENMLSLLSKENEISILSPVANKAQIPTSTKICEPTTPSKIQAPSSPNHVNYVGMLQEFCVQQKLTIENILYEVVDESGPPHMRIFTIEASIGSIREKGLAQCKKIAKQEAAKKLLHHLHPDINKLLNGNKNDTNFKMLEDTIRKLGIGISECMISKPALPVASLSKKAQTLYMKYNDKELKVTRQDFLLKDLHNLFEETYSNKISCNMREKMRIVRDRYTNHADIIEEVIQDIVRALKVKIEKTILPSLMKGYIICLRLSSNPIITQFGMDEIKDKAEIQ
ncbi:RISC-loading complex subunit tarbp2-like isoform X1 [Polyergus mexicanus]